MRRNNSPTRACWLDHDPTAATELELFTAVRERIETMPPVIFPSRTAPLHERVEAAKAEEEFQRLAVILGGIRADDAAKRKPVGVVVTQRTLTPLS